MSELSERLNTPISTKELERRWAAVRAVMDDAGIDVLVTQNCSVFWGYVRYFTDVAHDGSNGGYGTTLVFPKDGPMTMITSGPFGRDRTIDPAGEDGGVLRGVERVLTAPYFPGIHYTKSFDVELNLGVLAPYAEKTIGLLGTNQMVFPAVDELKRGLPKAKFLEASEMVDQIKMIKSKEEEDLIKKTAAVQDAAMTAACEAIKPGVRDIDVNAALIAFSMSHGSEYGLYRVGSSAKGEHPGPQKTHSEQRVIQKGDLVGILLESSGPGGFYCELGRTIAVGEPAPQKLKDELIELNEAQRFTASMLRPGTPCAEIFEKYNAYMREHGHPEEARIHCHGQGYDHVERPLIRHDETAKVAAQMNFACHPHDTISACDNYFVSAESTEKIHNFPQEIIEV